jgi:histidyl-tRNA synthetase
MDTQERVNGTVQPRLYRGMRDLFPEQLLARQQLLDTIRDVYERYGFVPLETPAIEYLDVLKGSAGQEATESIFAVRGPEEEPLGLRFDLTVPLARVVAQYPDLPRPFRRYQVSSVWRADNPGRGRFREFVQFDVDSVGVENELADAEIVMVLCDALAALNVGPFRVRVSSRRVLNLVLPYAGIPAERGADVFRVLDKLDKLGHEKIRLELTTGYKDESGSPVPGLGLSNAHVDRIEQFLAIQSPRRVEVLEQVRAIFARIPNADAEIEHLTRMSRYLDELGYGDDRVRLDVSIARGLAYYTGPVFEANLLDAPEFGAVAAGGRYDTLVARFLGQRVPTVGVSIGVDRLLAALESLGRIRARKSTAQVLISTMDPNLMGDYAAMAAELRGAGIRTELYLGMERRFGKQTKYGDQYDIPIVVVCGSDEKSRGVVQLKDMDAGRKKGEAIADRREFLQQRPGQFEIRRGELVEQVRRLLRQIEGG